MNTSGPMNPLAGLQAEIRTLRKHQARCIQDIAELRAESLLRQSGRTARLPIEFRAQFAEDALVWNFLGRPLEGFFIEVGAFDGVAFSVTHGLEAIGWNGLLIEALPEKAAACKAARPNSRVVHAALGPAGCGPTAEFSAVADYLGGMLSYLKTNAEHLDLINRVRAPTQRTQVPQTTMDELLKDHAGAIDLAVIDVEGGELDVLRGFDLGRFRPRVLLIEDNSMGRDPAIDQHMAALPYQMLGFIEVSRLYVRKDETEVLRRIAGM